MKISSSLIPLHPRPPTNRPDAERVERDNRRVSGERPDGVLLARRDASNNPDFTVERQRAREDYLHAARREAGLSFTARQALGEYRKTAPDEEQAQLRELLGVDVFA